MQYARTYARGRAGLVAPEVCVEVHCSAGLPGLSIVGLVETALRESRDRVRAALATSGFTMPDRRVTVALAPADLPKAGSGFDLAIAVAILAASGQVPAEALERWEFLGELGLSGELRSPPGLLPAMHGTLSGDRDVLVPASAAGAGFLDSSRIRTANTLGQVVSWLQGNRQLPRPESLPLPTSASATDLSAVQGQQQARRALEIAAAGGHHLLMSGSPGAGKTLLASCLPGLLPKLEPDEWLETAMLHSISGLSLPGINRPFRAPHHTASTAALVGGTADPLPGEISLAHQGVLFLDELPEFSRTSIEALREPLESRHVTIARAGRTVSYPADFQLVAAMNPCPCGNAGDPVRECRCTGSQTARYASRVSGPFLDRMDLRINLVAESIRLSPDARGESSESVYQRIAPAVKMQLSRQRVRNSRLHGDELWSRTRPDTPTRRLLESAAASMGLSRRGIERALRVGQTIADLSGTGRLTENHAAEALALTGAPIR